MQRGDDPANLLALMLGAVTECAKGLRLMVRPDDVPRLERDVLASVRGALRGAERPLNEDGTHHGDW